MFKLSQLLLMVLLVLPKPGNAINALFWQPQIGDMQISETHWRTLMEQVKQQGFDTLVLQWTRYGDAFSHDAERHALLDKARIAYQSGLQLIVGLNSDPAFFTRQIQPAAARQNYLNLLRAEDIAQANLWLQGEETIPLAGWYISAEIDDLHWNSDAEQAMAVTWLRKTRDQLIALKQAPVFISSFFAGHLSPEGYGKLIESLGSSGVHVWVQDGAGVGKLSASERALYLKYSASCSSRRPASGIVYEIFRQTSETPFKAVPAFSDDQQVERNIPLCSGRDRVLFSLRYLPYAKTIFAKN